jgi:hypothetical protein
MTHRRVDAAALVSGIVVICVGVLIVLDRGGRADLDFAELGPIALAALGAVLLAAGLARRRGEG